MKPFPKAWLCGLVVAVGLLPHVSLQLTSSKFGKVCPCQTEEANALPKDKLPADSSVLGTSTSISCCKDILLGYHDPGASILWSFNGEDYSEGWASSLRPRHCGNETIETTSGKDTDRGTYTCTITSTNGTSKAVSMTMTMESNIEYRDKPTAVKGSPNIVTTVGTNVTYSCEGYVGNASDYRATVTWVKYFPNNTFHSFLKTLPDVRVTKVIGSGRSLGMLKGQLVISSVQKIHFGIYECRIKNYYGSEVLNMTLTEGVPEPEAMALRYKTMVVVVASLLGLVVVLVVLWCRWGRLVLLYWRNRTASSDHHQYDVFLVHGDSASHWVWSVLLPKLEDTFGYSCFLPQRDMCGGDMAAESILEALSRCRRVMVLVTPCLLESPWATWATYSGIQAVLTSRARILALVQKEQSVLTGTSEIPFLRVLKVVRKIHVPHDLAWVSWEEMCPLPHTSTPVQQTEVQKTEMKLIIPDITVSTSISGSPRSQRLSNMITGSNTASRENLDSEKDKQTEAGGPIVFTDHGMQDPGSPNSVTPFILPSSCHAYRPTSDGSMCQSVGRCLQMVCVGNPEKLFWQTLRLHLGPPSLKQTSGQWQVTPKNMDASRFPEFVCEKKI